MISREQFDEATRPPASFQESTLLRAYADQQDARLSEASGQVDAANELIKQRDAELDTLRNHKMSKAVAQLAINALTEKAVSIHDKVNPDSIAEVVIFHADAIAIIDSLTAEE